MKPDKIYVDEDLINFHVLGERIHENDVEYIRKDALLEWAKEHQEAAQELHASSHDDYDWGHRDAFLILIDKLNEL